MWLVIANRKIEYPEFYFTIGTLELPYRQKSFIFTAQVSMG
jgi:hypothetical protein